MMRQFRIRPSISNTKDPTVKIIVISNKDNVQQSKYGEKYRLCLDPRDQMLPHTFEFVLKVQQVQYRKHSFMQTETYKNLCGHIEEYLVDVVENVISASFNFLMEAKLKENESKDYASKNILLNVQSVLKEVRRVLADQKLIDQKNKKENENIKKDLIELVENTLKRSLNNLSSYYPMAPPTGGTPKMRKNISSIDNSCDEQLDFLFTQGLKLQFEKNNYDEGKTKDYTAFIMRVVNRVIEVAGDTDPKDPLQHTLFERFLAFSENLFWATQEDSFNKAINSLKFQSENIFQVERKQKEIDKEKEIDKQNKIDKQKQKEKGKQISKQKLKIENFLRQPVCSDQEKFKQDQILKVAEKKRQDQLEKMRQKHDFAIDQKIPSSVKPFSKEDISETNFSAKNSAVLRILTKWAQNLQDVFDNPQAYTIKRNYPFKGYVNEPYILGKPQKLNLYKRILDLRQQKQKIKNKLIEQNKQFQSSFIGKDNTQNMTRFIKRYTQTRAMASKINALLIHFMKNYVSELIRLLIQAGGKNINLIIFRIGDLMRSKIHCSESAFICLLKTLYVLNETEDKSKPLFKLVRIKNKLDSRDNNILINYLFMGKVQCELQMSIQKNSGKEMNYYSIAHFLYELTRGKFGVLSQCATIICQHDPIVFSSSAELYYWPKKQQRKIQHQKLDQQTINVQQNEENKDKKDEQAESKCKGDGNILLDIHGKKAFICKKCDSLKFQQNMDLLKRYKSEAQICNGCLISQQKSNKLRSEQLLKNQIKSKQILQKLQLKKNYRKLTHYGQLLIQKKQNIIIENYKAKSGQQKYFTFIVYSINEKKNEDQFRIFSCYPNLNVFYFSQIPSNALKEAKYDDKGVLKVDNQLNVKEDDSRMKELVQYESISQKIKQKIKFSEFTYITSKEQFYQEHKQNTKLLNMIQIIKQQCKQKIVENKIQKGFQNKNTQLQFASSQQLGIMDKLAKQNSIKDFDNNSVQSLFIYSCSINKIPHWIEKCLQLKIANLVDNQISDISILQKMEGLQSIYLSGNQIMKQIDWRKLPKLKLLSLWGNNLTIFTIKHVSQSIQFIYISNNAIQSLNFQKRLPSLIRIDASANNLKQIQVKEMLVPEGGSNANYQNKNQYDRVGNSYYPSLDTILISNNQLARLSLSSLPSFKYLRTYGNDGLQQLQLYNLPNIQLFQMGRMNPNKLKIQKVNSKITKITGNSEMIKLWNKLTPNMPFKKGY